MPYKAKKYKSETQISWQQARHANLSSDLYLLGFKDRTFTDSGSRADDTLISAFVVPHHGICNRWRGRNRQRVEKEEQVKGGEGGIGKGWRRRNR